MAALYKWSQPLFHLSAAGRGWRHQTVAPGQPPVGLGGAGSHGGGEERVGAELPFDFFPDLVKIAVEMISPIAMDEKVRFAIREGGKTVGSGVVTKIVE